VSAEARDLIIKLLAKAPTDRIPLADVCRHPFIVRHSTAMTPALSTAVSSSSSSSTVKASISSTTTVASASFAAVGMTASKLSAPLPTPTLMTLSSASSSISMLHHLSNHPRQ
jgi:serine/threonine protein kinase